MAWRIFLTVLLLTNFAWAALPYGQLRKEGEQALKAKDYPAAIERFERLVRDYGKNADAHNLLGFALYQSGNTVRALYEFRQALSLSRHHGEAQHNLLLAVGKRATELANNRQYSEALNLLDEIVSTYSWHPQLAAVYYYRGKVLFLRGDEDKALESWRKAVERNPRSATQKFLEAQELVKRGKLQEAGVAYQAALKRIPNEPIFRNYYGRLLEDLGKYKLSLAQYEKVLEEENPNYLSLWLNASRVHRRLQDLDSATKALVEARNLRPDYASIHAVLASVLAASGNQSDSDAELNLALTRDPRTLVLIQGDPVGTVAYIDGEDVGPTPTAHFVDAGSHRLEVGLARQQITAEGKEVIRASMQGEKLTIESSPRPEGLAGRKAAPSFVLKDRKNNIWRLSQHLYKKQIVLLFWKVADPEAPALMGRLVGLTSLFPEQLVGAAIHCDSDSARDALTVYLAKPSTIGHLWDDGNVLEEYGGGQTPRAVVIDKEGFIKYEGAPKDVFDKLHRELDPKVILD